MEWVSLHLYDEDIARTYVTALRGETPVPAEWAWFRPELKDAVASCAAGHESAANQLTAGLALAMATERPSFLMEGFGFTAWEARVDRGVGMLMRPPARIFMDHGFERTAVASMPIRLDLQGGMMGGAVVPARLMPQLTQLLDERLERMAKRLKDADYDPYPMLALMWEAVSAANTAGLGLYESIDVVTPDFDVRRAPDKKKMDPALRKRIDLALKGEKKRGLLRRSFGNHV